MTIALPAPALPTRSFPLEHTRRPPLRLRDLLPAARYAAERGLRLARMREAKARRRLALGDHATVLFESRDTVLHHVHEIRYIEGGLSDDRLLDELSIHDPLVPRGDELTLSLFLDGPCAETGRAIATALARPSRSLRLRAGRFEVGAEAVDAASFPDGAVRYLRFPLGRAVLARPSTHGAVLTLGWPGGSVSTVLPRSLQHELTR